jgi:4-azaleucine resistance transporter AzlC
MIPTPEPKSATPVPRHTELWRGARDSLPMLLGAAPLGMIFGTLAVPSGLSPAGAIAMSLFVFAGSSQFIALSLFATGTGLAVIVLTTLVVNLRHALYSANLLPHVAHLPQRWRVPLAFWLTDETFAIVQQRYSDAGNSSSVAAADAASATAGVDFKHWYYLGSCLSMYFNWLFWTVAGVMVGRAVAGISGLGLEFAMAATFVAIVVPLLRTQPMLASALVAGTVSLLARGLPYKLGLMVAALAGIVAGVCLEKGRANDPA